MFLDSKVDVLHLLWKLAQQNKKQEWDMIKRGKKIMSKVNDQVGTSKTV